MARQLPVDVKRTLLVKSEEPTDPAHGCPPEERSLEEKLDKGLINLDKVAGPTSHEVASWVKRIFEGTIVSRTGHGGTLDPKVTGVLPIALNRATRAVDQMLTAGKEYVCIFHSHEPVDRATIEDLFETFTGKIYQRPPVRSAVKRNLRIREIYYLELIEMEETRVLFRVGCEAGTYIRKLCYDFGEVLGCGGHMGELRRTRSGAFRDDESIVRLQDIADAVYYWKEEGDEEYLASILHPIEMAFQHLPKVVIRDSAVDPICHGADLTVPGVLQVDSRLRLKEKVGIFTQKGEIVALGTSLMYTKQIMEEQSGFVARTERVFMDPGTYPKWVKK